MTPDEDDDLLDGGGTNLTFQVDTARRRIRGLLVPFGEPTHVAGMDGKRYRFSAGVLSWPADVSRHKLRIQHQRGTDTAYAVELREVPEGLWGEFAVARGAEGDKALQMAEDRVWDGFSIGLRDGAQAKRAKDGVYDFTAAELAETSLTPDPAFSSARVAAVALEAPQGEEPVMGDENTTENAQPVLGFSAEDLARALAEHLPQPVSPTEPLIEVNEQPYAFDARRGAFHPGDHEFSSDVFALARGDREAESRVMDFIRTQFDVDTADVTSVNPNRQRPDLYVDRREYNYPLWSKVNKGSLSDGTPFVFPKFNSLSTLVSAHTQGTEPSDGTFTATSQTVTPTALSGKVKITREVFDAGGSPQVSGLIWSKMQAEYFRALENSVPTALAAAAASITDITLTTAAVDSALVSQLLGAFADLQFVAGGFSMDTLALHIDLYKALAAAKDTTGRALLPYLNPTNAAGLSRGRFASLDIQGVEGIPAWALGATSGSSSNSWLFDSGSVHGWASAPQRLDFNIEVANVYLGVWGYKAVAISDFAGVRQVTYDPTS